MATASRSWVFVAAGLSALLSAASCAQIIGLEPFESTAGAGAGGAGAGGAGAGGAGAGAGGQTSTSSRGGGEQGGAAGASSATSAATGSGGGACGTNSTCVMLPNGWSGPVLLERGSACASGDTPVNLEFAPVDCLGCSCTPQDTCNFAVDTFDPGNNQCMQPDMVTVGILGCNEFGVQPQGGMVAVTQSEGGSCALQGACAAPSPDPIALCPTGPACPGGKCTADSMPACVYADPAVGACPNGFPSDRGLAYDQVMLSTKCTCGLPLNVDCTDNGLGLFPTTGCGGTKKPWTFGSCVDPITWRSVRYTPADTGTCDPPRVQVLSESGVQHICCTAPP